MQRVQESWIDSVLRAIAETEPGIELVYDSLQTTTIQTTSLDILVCVGG